MRVTMPSGATAEFRDVLLRGDIRTARKGMVFIIGPDGSRRSDGSFMDIVTGNIIRQMMVSWSLGTRPGDAQTDELAQQILDALPEDDYAALEKAVGPWVERIMRLNRDDGTLTHSATGIAVQPVNPGDAARLLASGEFTGEAAAGPKPASGPTGTSSSASRELTGPLATDGIPPTST